MIHYGIVIEIQGCTSKRNVKCKAINSESEDFTLAELEFNSSFPFSHDASKNFMRISIHSGRDIQLLLRVDEIASKRKTIVAKTIFEDLKNLHERLVLVSEKTRSDATDDACIGSTSSAILKRSSLQRR